MNKTVNCINFKTICRLIIAGAFALHLSTGTVQAKVEESVNESKTKAASTKKAKKKSSKRSKRKSVGLVPPPPPTIPRMLPGESMSIGSTIGIDYLSYEDLQFKLKSLKKNLEGLTLDLNDSKMRLDESVKRSSNFDGLYEEGVVSRKELENAKRETRRLKRGVEREELKVEEVKRVVEKVESRITELEKIKARKKTFRKKRKKRSR